MNKTSNSQKIIIAIIVLVILGLSIAWTIYQWNICMDVIGNTLYCLQHISN